jgi:hypothetical protein
MSRSRDCDWCCNAYASLTISSTDTTSPESRDRLRKVMIDKINSSEASVRALKPLKSRHNELAPISCLHCEVLAAIFSFLSVFAWNKGSGLLAWIYVAHVCRRWRETALNHPRFWSLTKLTPVGNRTHSYLTPLRFPLLPISRSTLLRKIVRSHLLILCYPLSPGYTSTSNLTIGRVKTCY